MARHRRPEAMQNKNISYINIIYRYIANSLQRLSHYDKLGERNAGANKRWLSRLGFTFLAWDRLEMILYYFSSVFLSLKTQKKTILFMGHLYLRLYIIIVTRLPMCGAICVYFFYSVASAFDLISVEKTFIRSNVRR